MSDLEFKPIHKFFRITVSSIKYMKHSNSDIIISLHVQNNSLKPSNNSSNHTTKYFTNKSKSFNAKTQKSNITTGNITIYG